MKQRHLLPTWFLWGLFLPLIALNGWVILQILAFFGSLASILLSATLLSFLLDYPVQMLQRLRIRRGVAVFLVLMTTASLLVILAATLVPALIEQMNELVIRIPSWMASGTEQVQLLQRWAITQRIPINVSKWANELDGKLASQLQAWSGQMLNFIVDLLGRFADVLLTFVLTLYLLLHGRRLWDGVFQWFPQTEGRRVRQLLNSTFHNYFVGQLTLAAIVGITMIVAFEVLGVPFGLLFGMGVGFMALFPFGIAFSISVISILMSFQNIWLGLKIFIVAFTLDVIIENVVAPQLMGGFTGLNPFWVILALLIGVRLGGLLGLVISVPLTSFIKSWLDPFRPFQKVAASEGSREEIG